MKSIIISIVAVSLSSCLVIAEPRGPKEHPHWGMSSHHLSRIVDLSESQKATLSNIEDRYRAQYKNYFEQLAPYRKSIKEEMDKPAPDFDKIRALLRQTEELHSESKLLKLRQMHETKMVLTPEQRDKLKEKFEKKKKEFKHRDHSKKEHDGKKDKKRFLLW